MICGIWPAFLCSRETIFSGLISFCLLVSLDWIGF
jgi:hypothetical protein